MSSWSLPGLAAIRCIFYELEYVLSLEVRKVGDLPRAFDGEVAIGNTWRRSMVFVGIDVEAALKPFTPCT
jgi:hypothetical protein